MFEPTITHMKDFRSMPKKNQWIVEVERGKDTEKVKNLRVDDCGAEPGQKHSYRSS